MSPRAVSLAISATFLVDWLAVPSAYFYGHSKLNIYVHSPHCLFKPATRQEYILPPIALKPYYPQPKPYLFFSFMKRIECLVYLPNANATMPEGVG
jgi:hypothetical protein